MPLVKPESKPLVDISSTSSDESDDDSEMIKGTEESYLLAIPFWGIVNKYISLKHKTDSFAEKKKKKHKSKKDKKEKKEKKRKHKKEKKKKDRKRYEHTTFNRLAYVRLDYLKSIEYSRKHSSSDSDSDSERERKRRKKEKKKKEKKERKRYSSSSSSSDWINIYLLFHYVMDVALLLTTSYCYI